MALLHQATCPKCGQVHMVTGMRSVYAAPAVEVCGECIVREAEEAAVDAEYGAVQSVISRWGPEATPESVLQHMMWKVLLRRVCKGRTEVETLRNIERFWNEVRKGVES